MQCTFHFHWNPCNSYRCAHVTHDKYSPRGTWLSFLPRACVISAAGIGAVAAVGESESGNVCLARCKEEGNFHLHRRNWIKFELRLKCIYTGSGSGSCGRFSGSSSLDANK